MNDTMNLIGGPARAFADGVRAANEEGLLCSRKLRIALQCLEVLATKPASGHANLEGAMEKAMREMAQTALDRIAGLK